MPAPCSGSRRSPASPDRPGPSTAARSLIGDLAGDEAAGVLTDLLAERPELAQDVSRLATARLRAVAPAEVEQRVVDDFDRLHFTAIADRVGRHGGGYVDETEAAATLMAERLEPYCREVVRLAGAGLPDAALAFGLATLAGLYRLRDEAKPGSLLEWVETEDEAWELATSVVLAFDDAGLAPPTETIDARFPDWAGIA